MSINAILKLDERKKVEEALAEFLAKGGEVRRVPAPTYFSETIRWNATYGHPKTKEPFQARITAQISRINAKAKK